MLQRERKRENGEREKGRETKEGKTREERPRKGVLLAVVFFSELDKLCIRLALKGLGSLM